MVEKQKTGEKKHIYLPDGREIENITDAIQTGRIISIVGGGGKTTTMYRIGLEYAHRGNSVILTTSTRIRPFANEFPPNLTYVGFEEPNGKLRGPENPDSLIGQCDYLLIEADGSKGLPLKMPASHEPVITRGTDTVLAVMGLQAIGHPIMEVCHRPEIVSAFLEKNTCDIVTVEDAARILISPKGLYKYAEGRCFGIILNHADNSENLENGRKIAALLPKTIPCVITSYEESAFL